MRIHKIGLFIGVVIVGSFSVLAYQMFTPSSDLIPALEGGDGLDSLPVQPVQEAERVSQFDLQNLKTADGLTYAEVRTAFDKIEAVRSNRYSAQSQSATPHMYVTSIDTKERVILEHHEVPTTRCSDGVCPKIPLYRLNQQTGTYDRIVEDLRYLPGYKQYVDSNFDAKDPDLKGEEPYPYEPQRIFTWSDDGRYVFFVDRWGVGDLYIDTKNLAEGFKTLEFNFADWRVSPDKTKSISFSSYHGYVVDFNTLKITPFFEALPDGRRLFVYLTYGMSYESWPYIRWIDNETIEYFTMPKKVVDAVDTCLELESKEKIEPCYDTILKENFAMLKRHEYRIK